jgi:hypothetical protein
MESETRFAILSSSHERVGNAAHMPRLILDADHNGASGGVCERHQRLKNSLGRRQIPLVFQGLSLGGV